jgi:hypothetical protein
VTVTATDDALAQLNTLLDEYDKIAPQLKHPQVSEARPEITALACRLLAAIHRLTPSTSAYAQSAGPLGNELAHSWLIGLATVARALRDDIAAGWLTSVVELAHADTYSGYLEMAEGLQGQGYKDAAAVIAGTSLEVHMKALATKHGTDFRAANGTPKKADTINGDLKREGVYGGLEQKQVTAWLHLRNSAAHGKYGEYTDANVKQLIEGVSAFAIKYPA